MKARWIALFVLLMCVALLTTWTASAQGPQPTATPGRGIRSQPSGDPGPSAVVADPNTSSSPSALLSGQNASPGRQSALTLGQPGLSFRSLQTFGVTGQAYIPPDNYHLNAPGGLFVDGSNKVFVAEDRGVRVLGYNSAASNILALGVPGWCVSTNTPPIGFCSPQDVGKDGSGNIWIADGGNRVVEFDTSGNYLQQLPPANAWYNGTDNTHFNYVDGYRIRQYCRTNVCLGRQRPPRPGLYV